MHVPLGCSLRPLNTGWFAEFGNLEKHSGSSIGRVGFAEDGFRFWGATFDPSGLYRFNAVMEWMRAEGLDTARVHEYVQSLQRSFLEQLHAALPNSLPGEALIHSELDAQGHFFTFDLLDAAQVCKQLAQRDVVTDIRSTCLRFGFGLYQTEEDIIQLFQRLTN